MKAYDGAQDLDLFDSGFYGNESQIIEYLSECNHLDNWLNDGMFVITSALSECSQIDECFNNEHMNHSNCIFDISLSVGENMIISFRLSKIDIYKDFEGPEVPIGNQRFIF